MGEEGELCVKGPAVHAALLQGGPGRRPSTPTASSHTGDLGSRSTRDGNVHFNQRIKDMIKTGGINVSPADVEMKLVQMDGVDAAHVFPVPAGEKGEAVGGCSDRDQGKRAER